MNEKIKRILKSFVIRAILIFVGWLGLYHGFILPNGKANQWLTEKVVIGTKLGLDALGYDTTHGLVSADDEDTSRYVFIDGQPVVLVADACNGMELMALFIGFLLAFPGPWKYKALLVPTGTLVIFILNVLREVILALNYKYFQETFEFNHKYTYVFIVYLAIFMIWRFWLNRYSAIGKKVDHA